MATVQKSNKINFYKFVPVKQVTSTAGAKDSSNIALTKAINTNTQAINNLGSTVNSLTKIAVDLKKAMLLQLDARQRKDFEPSYTSPKKSKGTVVKKISTQALKTPGFLENLFNLFGSLLKAAIVIPALQWLADPANQKKVEDVIDVLGKVFKFIAGWAKFGIVNTIEGLYDLLKEDATWEERLGGFLQGIVGFGSLLIGIRWLKNPTKIVTDFASALNFLRKNVQNFLSRRRRNPLRRRAAGGPVPHRSAGGWIRGPQSGYKVSLDGGRSTSFIGHGTEYVARKSNGGAFVVPFNTPATKRQPHLTQRRLGEARSQGYQLPGFSQGGKYLEEVKKRDGTSGDSKNKKIYLHWSGAGHNNTSPYKGNGYNTYIKGPGGQPVSVSKYGSGWPGHTYMKNGRNAAGIGLSAMLDYDKYGPNSWGPHAPTDAQYKGMAKEAAALATNWGWKPSDITDQRVRTHAEEYRDFPNLYRRHVSTDFRWDLSMLKPGQPAYSGGPKMREMIKREMTRFGPNTGSGDPPSDHTPGSNKKWNMGLGILDAVTGNLFNFDGVPTSSSSSSSSTSGGGAQRDGSGGDEKASSHNAHGFGALLDMIGKHESDSSGGYDAVNQIGIMGGHGVEGYSGPFSKMKQHNGKKLTSLTVGQVMDLQAPRSGMSDAEWIKQGRLHATGRYQIIGPTLKGLVDKGVVKRSDLYNEATQNKLGVELIKGRGRNAAALKSEWIGLKEETAGAILAAWDANGAKTSGGHSAASGGYSASGSGSGSYSSSGGGAAETRQTSPVNAFLGRFDPKRASASAESIYGDKAYSSSGMLPGEKEKAETLKKITEDRNDARQQINTKTQEIIRTALDAVAENNGANQQMVQQAAAQIQNLLARSQSSPQPQFVPTGGGGGGISGSGLGRAIGGSTGAAIGGTTAAVLNSFNNPLKGIFR
ncbi:endolysin [Synechococcus phage S-RS29]|nr:endolysin [Synechococcus phage S-RS29]